MCQHSRLKAPEKPPIALEVCYESRTVALKHYTPSFRSLVFSEDGTSSESLIFFNRELDTVYMVDPLCNKVGRTLSQVADKDTIHAIKSLACADHPVEKLVMWAGQSYRLKSIWGYLLEYKNLEDIIFVVKDESDESAGSIRKIQDSVAGDLTRNKSLVVRAIDLQAFEAEYQRT